MDQIILSDKVFENLDPAKDPLVVGEYEACTFINCDCGNANLSASRFLDCEFRRCNLSMAQLRGTSLRKVSFMGCKLLGLRFDTCNEFGLSVSFDSCTLDHSSFFRTKLKKTSFMASQLHDVDFSECDLTGATFEKCDLLRTAFHNTNLEKADFRTAFNYSIDPEMNRMKKAKFSLVGVAGLLEKYQVDIF